MATEIVDQELATKTMRITESLHLRLTNIQNEIYNEEGINLKFFEILERGLNALENRKATKPKQPLEVKINE